MIDEKYITFAQNTEDLIFSGIALVVIAAVFVLGFMTIQWIISKVCGN